jgi:hypothetical protein
MGICKLCIPSQKIIISEDDKIWFDSNLRTAIRLRDRLRRFYLKNKTEHNHAKFKNQRNKVNNMKKYAKDKFYTEINENLKDIKSLNSRLYWRTIQMLLKNDSPDNKTPPLHDPWNNMNLVYENEEKCNILNKYFCSVTHLENENKNLPDFD